MTVKTKGQTDYTVTYRDMRGVDLSGGGISRNRYAYLENMYRDYEGDGGCLIESVPGFRKIASLGSRVHRMYTQISGNEEFLTVHAGGSLYRFNTADRNLLGNLTPIASLKDGDSRGFSAGGSLYVLDGEKIVKVAASGSTATVGEVDAMPYVPTTYQNGVEYEQLNLLTDEFIERFLITSTDTVTYGTYALHFRITDPVNHLCAVVGIDKDFRGAVSIPSYKRIGEITYRVNEIADKAFQDNENLYELTAYEGVTRIGHFAFSGCTGLTRIRLPSSVEIIEDGAFAGIGTIAELQLGTGLKTIGEAAFTESTLTRVSYPLDATAFSKIENASTVSTDIISYNAQSYQMTAEIRLHTPTRSILSVTVDGKAQSFSSISDGELIGSVVFKADDSRYIEGKEVVIRGVASGKSVGFYSNKRYTGSGFDAITKCRVCECFDGRVFLSGNPELPNTVFYSGRDDTGNNNPLYYGCYNYFEDGIGDFPVVAMLAAGDMLAVFKAGDDGGGSVFYHSPAETGQDLVPKIYPVAYLHNGIGALGEAISFFDDPLFLTKNGVMALDKQSINLERSVVCRSHNVNSHLLRENLKGASMAKWQGYLALLAGSSIYLADSRATFTHATGAMEYEWYYLTHIGTFKDSTRVYNYSSIAEEGYEVYEQPDTKTDKTVMSTVTEDGRTVFYCEADGHKYTLYRTEELEGGIFSPATTLCSAEGELLFFGTESGDLCVFNNDKRGVPPSRISSDEAYDEKEYASVYGRRIHSDYYSFAGHAVRYALKTAMDDCSIPHLTKSTVKHSLAVKCRNLGYCRLICEVGTDKNGYSEVTSITGGECSFYDLNFSSVMLSTEGSVTLPIGEKEKNWVEKQIVLYTDAFRAPFGVYSITYRFNVKGRIKKS